MKLSHKIAWIFFSVAQLAAVFLLDWRVAVVGVVGWLLICVLGTPTRKK